MNPHTTAITCGFTGLPCGFAPFAHQGPSGTEGNFGHALAYACRKRGLPLAVYAATRNDP